MKMKTGFAFCIWYKIMFQITGANEKYELGCWSTYCNHAITNHCLLIIKFIAFNIILPSWDIYTDVITAFTFFKQNHIYWGSCTLVFVFLPFVGRLLMFTFSLGQIIIKKKVPEHASKWHHIKKFIKKSDILWHIPPLVILR